MLSEKMSLVTLFRSKDIPIIILCLTYYNMLFFADTGKKVGVLCMTFVVYAAKRYEECLLVMVSYLYTRTNENSLYNKDN